MEIFATTDTCLIDRIAAGSPVAAYRASLWVESPGVTVLAAMHEGQPVAGALILDHGMRGLPEVHLQMAPGHGGEETIAAVAGFKSWLIAHRPTWRNVWTFAQDERTARFAARMGFVETMTIDGNRWFFYPLHKEAAA